MKQHTVEVKDSPEIEGEGKPRRNISSPDELTKHPKGITSLYENFQRGLSLSKDRPFFGSRKLNDGVLGGYTWTTYDQANQRITNFASGLLLLGMKANDNLGLFSINCEGWIIAEQASFQQSLVTVPLYDTLGDEAIEYICNQSEIKVIVATKDKAKIIIKLSEKIPGVKTIVVMDGTDEDLLNSAAKLQIKVISMEDVESTGKETPATLNPSTYDSVATICYTSGTTGLPKGVILTHGNLVAFIAMVEKLMQTNRLYKFSQDDVHISYLPLAHVFERVVIITIIMFGASFGFYQGDTLKLMDDVAILKPTVFASVPRLYNRIYDKVTGMIESAGGIKSALFYKAFNSKKAGLQNGYLTHWLWDRLIFAKIKQRLGGNVKIMLTGAAPISSTVVDFLRCAFSVQVYEGYGQTESGACICLTDVEDYESGHIGAPSPSCEVKLVDIPSMGYTSKDTPYPRGEMCFRGHNAFKGYYKLPEKTSETIDSDGWVHTGDVGMWDDQGRVRIIDRLKNIFKLSQGEYIAPEKIENVYSRHPLIGQIFVYGDSLQSTLVAVVIPDETIQPWAVENGFIHQNMKEYCQDDALKKAFLDSMIKFGKESELKGFECVKNIWLHPELFSVENGLLTPTFKLKRHEAKILFQEHINRMYAELET